MDSSRFPVVCYADLGERTFGRFIRHVFNVFQSIQCVLFAFPFKSSELLTLTVRLFFIVAILINGNGQVLAQLVSFKACFLLMCFVWFAVGAIGGTIHWNIPARSSQSCILTDQFFRPDHEPSLVQLDCELQHLAEHSLHDNDQSVE